MTNATTPRSLGCVLLGCLALGAPWPVDSGSLASTQLAGLKGVNLTVYVSRDVPDADALASELRAQAKEILARGGVSDEGPDGVYLSVNIRIHPADKKLRPGDVLVQVKAELSEHVRLDRDRLIKVPQGAVTWSEESVSIEPKAELRGFAKKQIEWAVGLFTDEVKGIRKLSETDVRNR